MWFCGFFFHRLSAGSFVYLNDNRRIFVNLNVNGELMFSVLSGYMCFFYVLVPIVSYLFDCRDTREGMLM